MRCSRRLYGTQQSARTASNMCHETTVVALKKSIGVGVGTVVFDDFAKCDAMFFFGQNPGSNSPRFLHPLQDAAKRGVQIITFNPVREKGLEAFVNPQNPTEMLTGKETGHQQSVPSGQGRWRHRGHSRNLQARLRRRRRGQAEGQTRARCGLHRAAHQRFRRIRGQGPQLHGMRSRRHRALPVR